MIRVTFQYNEHLACFPEHAFVDADAYFVDEFGVLQIQKTNVGGTKKSIIASVPMGRVHIVEKDA